MSTNSTAAHTAGLWFPQKIRSLWCVRRDNGTRRGECIASGLSEDHARLFAAAPDLLAALEAADETLTSRDACNIDPILNSDNPHEHAAGMVRAAIAAAKAGANR